MANKNIGKMEPVPIREVWPHEERDFSKWLQENLNFLSEVIGKKLSFEESEKKVGSFELDILAGSDDGSKVIIENQFGVTDHGHLGKVITYFTNLEAKIAIWVTADAHPEHIRAIAWLNEITSSDTSFYLVKVEAYKIGDSPPAPKFTLIAGPNEDVKSIGQAKEEWAERHVERYNFWTQLLTQIKTKKISLFSNISPSKGGWISTGAGKTGFSLAYLIWMDKSGFELYIDTADKDENKRIFDELSKHKQEIEKHFDTSLVRNWDRIDSARASRIQYRIDGGLKNKEAWPEIQEKMIDSMDKFAKALRPYIKTLR